MLPFLHLFNRRKTVIEESGRNSDSKSQTFYASAFRGVGGVLVHIFLIHKIFRKWDQT